MKDLHRDIDPDKHVTPTGLTINEMKDFYRWCKASPYCCKPVDHEGECDKPSDQARTR